MDRHWFTTITRSQVLWSVRSHDPIATTWLNSPSRYWRSNPAQWHHRRVQEEEGRWCFAAVTWCKYHTSNDVFAVQKCAQNGYREKWWWIDTAWWQDENLDTKWKIQKSGKSRIVYGLVTTHNADANDNIHACVILHDADVNDNINDCVALHDAYTTDHFHWTWARIVSSVHIVVSHHLHTHRGSRRLSLLTSSTCAWSSVRSLHLDSPFLFPALPHVPYLLPPVPEARGKPAQLRQREYGLHRRVLPLQAKGGAAKKRFQHCVNPNSSNQFLYLRAIQGHPGETIDLELQDHVLIPEGFIEYLYFVGNASELNSIIRNGLIPGEKKLKRGRQAVFFIAVNPMEDENSRSEGFPRTRMTKSSCACDSGRGLVSVGAFFFLLSSFFLSFFFLSPRIVP